MSEETKHETIGEIAEKHREAFRGEGDRWIAQGQSPFERDIRRVAAASGSTLCNLSQRDAFVMGAMVVKHRLSKFLGNE